MNVVVASWPPRSVNLTLGPDDVHVWLADLAACGGPEPIDAPLSAEERDRAARFRFPRDRDRFVAAHALLRTILGRYLGAEPGALTFETGAHGKPRLARPTGRHADPSFTDLRFNMSHSGARALYAVTRGREVGVDIERIAGDRYDMRTAARWFSPREVATLHASPAERRPRAFFSMWVRKEAYVKARGDGLTRPLDRFSVSLDDEPANVIADDDGAAPPWRVYPVDAGDGYAAAIVIQTNAPLRPSSVLNEGDRAR